MSIDTEIMMFYTLCCGLFYSKKNIFMQLKIHAQIPLLLTFNSKNSFETKRLMELKTIRLLKSLFDPIGYLF